MSTLKLRIAVTVEESYGNDWGFKIEETMERHENAAEYVKMRVMEEINRHSPAYPTRFLPLQLEAGSDD